MVLLVMLGRYGQVWHNDQLLLKIVANTITLHFDSTTVCFRIIMVAIGSKRIATMGYNFGD